MHSSLFFKGSVTIDLFIFVYCRIIIYHTTKHVHIQQMVVCMYMFYEQINNRCVVLKEKSSNQLN